MKPKKLNLNEIWELYLILEPALRDRDIETDVLDEVDRLLELSPSGTLVACLDVLYDNIKVTSGAEVLELFIKGISRNEFYSFIEFVKALK